MPDDRIQQLLREPVPREWAFPERAYRTRLARVRQAMGQHGIDVLLVHSIVDSCYLTGYQSLWSDVYGCLIVPQAGEPFMQALDIEVANAVLHGLLRDFVSLGGRRINEAAPQLAQVLADRGYGRGRIGVQKGRLEMGKAGPLDAAAYERLRELLPHATFVDATELVFDLRVKKSPAEIEAMKRAGRITSAGIHAALEAIAPGRLDNEVAKAGASAMLDAGSEFFSIDPIVSVGHRSAWTHTNWKRHPIKPGDHVLLEFGGVYQRYTAPMVRTAVVGKPTDLARRLADALLNTFNLLCENVRPGRTAHDVAMAAARGLDPVRTPDLIWTGHYGYSVGLGFPPTWSDGPMYLMEGNERVLEPGMTFHATFAQRVPRQFIVGVSETIAVTDTGCQVLTDPTRELVVKPS